MQRNWFQSLVFFVLLISGFFQFENLKAQPGSLRPEWQHLPQVEDTLATLSNIILTDSIATNRFIACRQMIPTLVRALKSPNSFDYPFPKIESISIQYPEDSTFRIFTWQLVDERNDVRYYGAIQMNTPELKLFPLVDRSFSIENPESVMLSADKWFGALYYRVKAFDTPTGKKYLCFGFDADNMFLRKKLVDVLSFGADGKPVFGAPVFQHFDPDGMPSFTRSRVFLEYSADAKVKFNYDEAANMIIFDHLVPLGSLYNGQGMALVPDGTYEAYELKDGIWRHVDKLEITPMEEAPRPEPVLENTTRDKKTDLFGRRN